MIKYIAKNLRDLAFKLDPNLKDERPSKRRAKKITELLCRIDAEYSTYIKWSLWDGRKCIGWGASSSRAWAKQDACERSRADLDELYPNGWNMKFDF